MREPPPQGPGLPLYFSSPLHIVYRCTRTEFNYTARRCQHPRKHWQSKPYFLCSHPVYPKVNGTLEHITCLARKQGIISGHRNATALSIQSSVKKIIMSNKIKYNRDIRHNYLIIRIHAMTAFTGHFKILRNSELL